MRGGTDGSILGGHANPYAIAGRLMSVTFKAGFLYEILKDYAYTLSCIRTLFFYIARDAHVHVWYEYRSPYMYRCSTSYDTLFALEVVFFNFLPSTKDSGEIPY